MRRAALGSVLTLSALCALLAVGACGRSASSTGSNTNWLERCGDDADCGSGRECWCGACTKPCAETLDCGSSGQCRASGDSGCGEQSSSGSSVCVLTCTGDGDCAGEGSDLSCRNGVCLPAVSMAGAGGNGNGTGGGDSASGGDDGTAGDGVGGTGGMGSTSGFAGSSGVVPAETSFPRGKFGTGGYHTCVVYAGNAYCWGNNLQGQVGGPPAREVTEPRLVEGVSNITQIALSPEHTCALTGSGDVYCWGMNEQGQVGSPNAPNGTCPDYVLDSPGEYGCQPTPTRVPDISGAIGIGVASSRSCAVLADHTLQCWGQLGELADRLDRTDVTGIELGNTAACIIEGNGWDCSFSVADSSFPPPSNEIRVSDSSMFWCVLDPNPYHVAEPDERKRAHCIGDNSFGQCGAGDIVPHEEWTEIELDITDLVLGDAHACALGVDQKVYCWGRNLSGQVGPTPLASPACGSETCEPSPREVVGLPPMQSIAAGSSRTCGFAVDGTLWCWGDPSGRGAPLRVAGPWEQGGAACAELLSRVASRREDVLFSVAHECVVDSDCVQVPLDIPCHRTCAVDIVSAQDREATEQDLAQIAETECGTAEELGCALPALDCAKPTTRAICDGGHCTSDDPEHTGCTDHCACSAVRSASFAWKDECSGFDLWPAIGLGCAACEDSTLVAVIMNRGSERFEGDAVITFEPFDAASGGATELPEPVTLVGLALDPGAISPAISISSLGAGEANLRVTAAGDCNPLDDASEVTLPSPTNACD